MKRGRVTGVIIAKEGQKQDGTPWKLYGVSILVDGKTVQQKTFDGKIKDFLNKEIDYRVFKDDKDKWKFEFSAPSNKTAPSNDGMNTCNAINNAVEIYKICVETKDTPEKVLLDVNEIRLGLEAQHAGNFPEYYASKYGNTTEPVDETVVEMPDDDKPPF